jgi:hypothetical protein
MLLVDRIAILEQEISDLKNKILDLSKNTEQKYIQPITRVGGTANKALQMPVDIDTGFGAILGNGVIFNDSELGLPPVNAEPSSPTKGYNKHTHSRYSGGALIKQTLEIVEYDSTWWAAITNPHSQQFWQTTPKIRTTTNSKGETVQMIGALDLVFNPDGGYDSNNNPIGKWGVATLEIDIKACQFVQRRTTDGTGGEKIGDIELDSKGQEMKGPLWNADQTKSSIIWDEDGKCFRLYAAYSPGTVDGL